MKLMTVLCMTVLMTAFSRLREANATEKIA